MDDPYEYVFEFVVVVVVVRRRSSSFVVVRRRSSSSLVRVYRLCEFFVVGCRLSVVDCRSSLIVGCCFRSSVVDITARSVAV